MPARPPTPAARQIGTCKRPTGKPRAACPCHPSTTVKSGDDRSQQRHRQAPPRAPVGTEGSPPLEAAVLRRTSMALCKTFIRAGVLFAVVGGVAVAIAGPDSV